MTASSDERTLPQEPPESLRPAVDPAETRSLRPADDGSIVDTRLWGKFGGLNAFATRTLSQICALFFALNSRAFYTRFTFL